MGIIKDEAHELAPVRHRHSQGRTTVLTPLLKNVHPNIFGKCKEQRMVDKPKWVRNHILLVETDLRHKLQ